MFWSEISFMKLIFLSAFVRAWSDSHKFCELGRQKVIVLAVRRLLWRPSAEARLRKYFLGRPRPPNCAQCSCLIATIQLSNFTETNCDNVRRFNYLPVFWLLPETRPGQWRYWHLDFGGLQRNIINLCKTRAEKNGGALLSERLRLYNLLLSKFE